MQKFSAAQAVEVGFWFVFAALAFYFTFDFDRKIEIYKFGASGWPRVVIGAMAVVALCLLAQKLRGIPDKEEEAAVEGSEGFAIEEKRSSWRLLWVLGLPICYAFILPYTSFYVTTPFFIAAYLFVTGERRPAWLIGTPIVISVVLIFFFTKVFYVGLPVGYWHPFYDISNWLVSVIQ